MRLSYICNSSIYMNEVNIYCLFYILCNVKHTLCVCDYSFGIVRHLKEKRTSDIIIYVKIHTVRRLYNVQRNRSKYTIKATVVYRWYRIYTYKLYVRMANWVFVLTDNCLNYPCNVLYITYIILLT